MLMGGVRLMKMLMLELVWMMLIGVRVFLVLRYVKIIMFLLKTKVVSSLVNILNLLHA